MKKVFLFLMMFVASVNLLSAQWSSDPMNPIGITEDGRYGQDIIHSVVRPDGKIYLSWVEADENFSFSLYLQLLDNDGKKLWNDKLLVSDYPTLTWISDYALAVAPNGDALLTFYDLRHDPENEGGIPAPYVYRISQDGEFVWGREGIALPYESLCGAGQFYVFENDIYVCNWELEGRNSWLSLMKLNDDGSLAFDAPVKFSGKDLTLIPTETNDLLAVWIYNGSAIGAQRINRNCEPVWTEVLEIDNRFVNSQFPLEVVSDGKGGFVVAYGRSVIGEDGNPRNLVCVQHVAADKSFMMGETSVDLPGPDDADHGLGGLSMGVNVEDQQILLFWATAEGPVTDRVGKQRLQLLDYTGKALWIEDGLVLREDPGAGRGFIQQSVFAMPDGEWVIAGGIGLGFYEKQVFAQRFDVDGNTIYEKKIGKEMMYSDVQIVTDNKQVFFFCGVDSEDAAPTGIIGQNMWFDGTFGVDSGSVEGFDADNGVMWYDALTSQLRFSEPIDGVVEVFNLQGMKVATQSAESVEALSLSLSSGVYIVRVQSVDKVFSDKVIVR